MQVFPHLVLVDPQLVSRRLVGPSMSVQRSPVVFCQHALLFLVNDAAHLESVEDIHLRPGRTVCVKSVRLQIR